MKNVECEKACAVGIDLAKNVFQVHAVDSRGKVVLRRKVSRKQLVIMMQQMPKSLVGMEACGRAHYWGRAFRAMRHEVRLIPPQYVKPYVKTNKNDAADAEAIVEAVSRPNMRFVAIKEEWQQDMLSVHRVRDRLVRERTGLMNEIRGLLHEYGLVIPLGRAALGRCVAEALGDADNNLTMTMRRLIGGLVDELQSIEARIAEYDTMIRNVNEREEQCQRISKVRGIGPVTATALVAAIGDANHFTSGRNVGAWLGMVPRQHSTGGKERLLGISKRGDSYIRKLLIHGARSVVHHARNRQDRLSRWVCEKERTRGVNKACVALANKNARIVRAMLKHGTEYDGRR